jgi:hypothetical protein
MKAPLILFVLLLASGCTAAKSQSRSVAEPITVEGVNVADGVTEEEGHRIALRYFDEFHGSCGGMDLSEETATTWRFRTVVGFAATRMPDIVVQKDGSKISQEGTPDAVYKAGVWRYRGRNFYGDEGRD